MVANSLSEEVRSISRGGKKGRSVEGKMGRRVKLWPCVDGRMQFTTVRTKFSGNFEDSREGGGGKKKETDDR